MKILSIAIPSYNSQAYMRNCIESLLVGGEDVEIIIVNDGSKDDTAKIADEYQEKYPTIVKAVHQVNGGHGEAVNSGLRNATGVYYKVVDSDDWVNEEAYKKILSKLKEFHEKNEDIDMMISNYVYEKEGKKHKKVIHYRSALPQNKVFNWDVVKNFHPGQYILMHSVIYRTQMLKECGLELPKHTFYVDNIFVFHPLPYVKKMYYMDVDFYRYYIGRSDQSVNEKVMMGRIDQQLRVNKILMNDCNIWELPSKPLQDYMISYIEVITAVSSTLLLRINTEESLKTKEELWDYMKQLDERLYNRIRHSFLGFGMNLPGKIGRQITLLGYRISQKIFGFN